MTEDAREKLRTNVHAIIQEHPDWSVKKVASETKCGHSYAYHAVNEIRLHKLSAIPMPAGLIVPALYDSILNRLAVLAEKAQRDEALIEAVNFIRWLNESKLLRLLACFSEEYRKGIESKAEKLLRECNERLPFTSYPKADMVPPPLLFDGPSFSSPQLRCLHQKIDILTDLVVKLKMPRRN
jgi:hypothetical protein